VLGDRTGQQEGQIGSGRQGEQSGYGSGQEGATGMGTDTRGGAQSSG
jgi:hypothetical protein